MLTLPTFYYLTHFDQSLQYISDHCESLLNNEQLHTLRILQALPKLERALMARLLNRKTPFVPLSSLNYPELGDVEASLEALKTRHLVRTPKWQDLAALIDTLTKAQLMALAQALSAEFAQTAKLSWSKTKLLTHIQNHIDFAQPQKGLATFFQQFIYRSVDQHFDYFLFLFFGHVRGQLTQFSLRDLGIVHTRDDIQASARFEHQADAWSCYCYERAYRLISGESPNSITCEALPPISGHRARDAANRYFVQLAMLTMKDQPEKAVEILSLADSAIAFEKRMRLLYGLGERESVQTALEAAIESPDSDEQMIFAEDFLARKFRKKKRSVYTDLLHTEQTQILIDESAKNRVEHQVVAQYRHQGVQAWRTENKTWRCLFGILFWDLLFESSDTGLCNEFDRTPSTLIDKTFWASHQDAIVDRLTLVEQRAMLQRHLVTHIAQYYGKPNPIFRWHANILETVSVLTQHAPPCALSRMLMLMSQDYPAYKDGFPDLALLQNDQLVFEELKAPGDSLRKNQLVTIRALQDSGFPVRISRVAFIRDHNARYAVVDIETTGGRQNGHRITEIGIVLIEKQRVIERWSQLINPQRSIPKNITALTGISNAMVSDQPVFADIAAELKEKLTGCIFVAHNVNFDYGFIQAEFNRLEEPIAMPKLCTVRECKKQFPGLPSYSLANLCRHFDVSLVQHHRALADAQAAAELLLKVFVAEQGQAGSAQDSGERAEAR